MQRYVQLGLVFSAAMLCVPPGGLVFGQAPGSPGTAPQPGSPPPYNQPNSPTATPRIGEMPGTNEQPQMAPKVNDRKFVKDAAMGGLAEVEMGKLAVQKASSDSVKQFGQKLIDDHTKANDQLRQVASQQSVQVPESLDSKHRSKVDKLSKLSGPAFDHAFVKEQVKDHQEDVRAFKEEARNGTMPQVKDFAYKTLPTLESHLELAKNLKKTASR
ncbi:MAG: DUF4142 domain-containing protein [Bryobacteraceae bacterium]